MVPFLNLLAQVDVNSDAYRNGRIIGALVIGLLCGCIPLKMGQSRGQTLIGLVGFAACTVAGLFLGLIGALPVAGLFALMLAFIQPPRKKKKKAGSVAGPGVRRPAPTHEL